MRRLLLLPLVLLLVSLPAKAQVFEAFRPVYMIGGVPLSGPVNKSTADLKFQFSLYGEALSDWVRGFHPVPHLRFGLLIGKLL